MLESLEEKEKLYKEEEANVSALSRRIMLMEEESKKADQGLADTVTKRSAMLEPGDEAVLGPFKVDPLEPITLRVRIVDDVFGGTQSERLEPGDQTFVIENGNLQSWEAVRIRRESD